MITDARRGPEAWAWIAFTLGGAAVTGLIVLGSRPGGRLPILLYTRGPMWLSLAAFVVLLGGGLWSVTHRPLVQRRRVTAFTLLAFLTFAAQYPLPYPSSHEGRISRAEIELPVEGTWTVRWGGDHWRVNPFVATPDRRWSLHLVVTMDRVSGSADADEPGDFHCFGREVRAPVDGRVVRVHDGEPDALGAGSSAGLQIGNYVCLEVGDAEYLFLSGLAQGSIAVEEGQRVARGRPVARVGSSATSFQTPEPSLSMHLADSMVPGWGEAVPWLLHRYRTGGRHRDRGRPQGGLGSAGVHRGEIVERSEPFPPEAGAPVPD